MDIQVLASSSSGNAYIIGDGHTRIMLDCGLPYKELQKKSGFTLSSIDAVLLSHEHMDHAKAAKDLLKMGTSIYTSQGTADALGLKLDTCISQNQFTVGTMIILPFDVNHDAADPLGYLIYSTETKEKLLYATDTYYIKYKFSGLNYILVECNYSMPLLMKSEADLAVRKRIIKSHMSIETLLDFLKANDLSKVRQIYLCHLSAERSDATDFRRRVMMLTGKETIVC